MKFLKRVAAVAAAALTAVGIVCAGSVAVSASPLNESTILPAAESPLYTVSMSAQPSVPEQGKEMILSINVTPKSGTTIKQVDFELNFNTTDFEYLKTVHPDIDDSGAGVGRIKFSRVSNSIRPTISGEVLQLKFTAKLPSGKIRFNNTKVVDSNNNDITTVGEWRDFSGSAVCDHNYNRTERVITSPTCTQDGTNGFYCSNCGSLIDTKTVKALGHDWDRTKATYTTLPNCTNNGTVSIPCKRTGCKETQTETVPALGHDWGQWQLTKAASGNQMGQETRECKRCNAKETRNSSSTGPVVTTTVSGTTAPQVSIVPTILIDEPTGVRLDFKAGAVANDAKLTVKTLAQTSNLITYDITLMRGDQPVQPSSTLYITIDLPSSMKGENFYVYRDNNDGTYTDMLATYISGDNVNRVSFMTGHLSEYIITTERREDVVNAAATSTTAATSAPAATTAATAATSATTPQVLFEETTTAAVSNTTAPPSSNAGPDVVIGTGGNNTNGGANVGNTNGGGTGKDNPSTGILAISIPLIAAAVGIFVAKKR